MPMILKKEVTIASSGTTSTSVASGGAALVGFYTPASLTSTAFAFESSMDGSSFSDVYDTAGSEVSYTVAAGQFISVSPTVFCGCDHLRVVAGSSEGAERTVTLVFRKID